MLSLSSEQTAALVDPASLLGEIREALAKPAPDPALRDAVPITPRDGAMSIFPLRAPGVPCYGFRVETRHFLQPRVVTYVLHDQGTGSRLAVVDGTFLASLATGCAAALQAPPGARVGIVGAGELTAATLWMLKHVRALEEVLVHDPRPGRAEALAAALHGELQLEVRAATRDEAMAAPLTLDEETLGSLDTSLAECVALWHVYARARDVSTTRPTRG